MAFILLRSALSFIRSGLSASTASSSPSSPPARRSGFQVPQLPSGRAHRRGHRTLWAGLAALSLITGGGVSAEAQAAHPGGVLLLRGGFSAPAGVVVDASGNVYVADENANTVTEIVAVGGVVSSNSPVQTLGSPFNFPEALGVDRSGNVYVADTGNAAVEEILTAGVGLSSSSTVNSIGSGFQYPGGVAVDGNGNVFITDVGTRNLMEVVAAGGVVSSSSPVTNIGATLLPQGVAVDSHGNVFFVAEDWTVKEIVAVGGVVSPSATATTVGSGFYNPYSLAVDGKGNVFVADTFNNAIKEIVAVNGIVSSSSTVTTIVSGLNQPTSVSVDSYGNLFIADRNNGAVKELVNGVRKFPTTAIGGTATTLSLPFTFDSAGSIGAPLVLTMGATGLDFTDAGTGTCTTNGTSHSYNPGDVCTVDVTFHPMYPGQRMGVVQLLTTSGATIATAHIYGTGTGPLVTFPMKTYGTALGNGLSEFLGVAVDGSGDVFVADTFNNVVSEIVATGGVVSASSTVKTIGSGFSEPYGVAVDGSGNVFVADTFNGAVKEIVAVNGVVSSGSTVTTIASGLFYPQGIAVDAAGDVFVADSNNNAVKEIVAVNGVVSSGSTVNTVGSGFNNPQGIAVDAAGDVFVADSQNFAVKEIVAASGLVSSSSTVNTIGSGFGQVSGVAVDAAGDVFVADGGRGAVEEIVATGGAVSSSSPVTTLTPNNYYSPFGIAVSPNGNIFIANPRNSVAELDLSDAPTLSFATATLQDSTDSTDGVQTVTVANSGNADLSFPIPASGNNPAIGADFTLDSTSAGTCSLTGGTASAPGTLAWGTSCTLPVSFVPATSGSISDSLVLTDTNLNANPGVTQSIALYGIGIAPVAATQAVASSTLQVNLAATPFTPVTGSGGVPSLVYSISPALPAGLGFNAATGSVTGTPTATSPAATYTVTITDGNSSTATASFSLSVTTEAATLVTTPSATSLVYGQPVTLNAVVSAASTGGSAPTGSVTFYDGTTALTPNATLTNGAAGYTVTAPTAAAHTYYAMYLGDANFAATGRTAATSAVTFAQAAATLTGPAQAAQALFGQGATIAVAIAGQYSGAGIAGPSGSAAYAVVSAAGTSVASGSVTIASGSVAVPVATSLAPGSYVVSVSYAGDANYAASASAISIPLTITGQIAPVVAITAPGATTNYGAAVGITATATYNNTSVPGGFTYTATLTGGAASPITAATVLPAGSYTLTAAFTPTDTTTYKAATASSSLTVAKAASGIALTSSVNPAPAQNLTILTATVSAATGKPTGSVTFLDSSSSTPLGTAALTAGVATLQVSSLAAGTHTVSAVYSGDANFQTATSVAVSQQVLDFSLATGNSTSSVTIQKGGSATLTLDFSPVGAATFPAATTLTVTGLPSGATATLTPQVIAAGAGSTNVALNIQMSSQTAMLDLRERFAPATLALLLLPFSLGMRKRAGKLGRLLSVLLLVASAVGVAGLTGCGGSSSPSSGAPQSYTVTITGTSGALSHTTSIDLTVQ